MKDRHDPQDPRQQGTRLSSPVIASNSTAPALFIMERHPINGHCEQSVLFRQRGNLSSNNLPVIRSPRRPCGHQAISSFSISRWGARLAPFIPFPLPHQENIRSCSFYLIRSSAPPRWGARLAPFIPFPPSLGRKACALHPIPPPRWGARLAPSIPFPLPHSHRLAHKLSSTTGK
jgi:hypothetical protein